jgi:cytochrome bd-type quinol oxidase subunit 2
MFEGLLQPMHILVILVFVLPLFINYKLVKSRSREKEMWLWMLLTVSGRLKPAT